MIVNSGQIHRNGTRPHVLSRDIIVAPQFGKADAEGITRGYDI
jgi:hypothetical protein